MATESGVGDDNGDWWYRRGSKEVGGCSGGRWWSL